MTRKIKTLLLAMAALAALSTSFSANAEPIDDPGNNGWSSCSHQPACGE